MITTRHILPIVGLLIVASAVAAEPAKPVEPPAEPAADGNACTWSASVSDWRELDNRNLVVWASRSEFFHVELSAPLIDLGTADSIAFVDSNHDGRVCGFGMDEIAVPRSTMFGRSSIISMKRLDDAGLLALGEKYHVKFKLPKAKQNAAAVDAKTSEATAK